MFKTFGDWLRYYCWWCILIATSLILVCLVGRRLWLQVVVAPSDSNLEKWSSLSYHSDTIGVIGHSYNDNFDYRGMIDGSGILCLMEFGSSMNGSTGGTYEFIVLQLPNSIRKGDSLELSSRIYRTVDFRESKIFEMNPNEVYVVCHRRSSTFSIRPTENTEVKGRVTIIDVFENRISMHLELEAKVVDRIHLNESTTFRTNCQLELNRIRSPKD